MANQASTRRDYSGMSFKQQDASAWISFDPDLTGHRRDVRSAAAKSSAAARKATIARKLALNTDCSTPRTQATSRSSKRRRHEQQDASPMSASSSSATLHSRRQSEISLASLATACSPTTSRSGSPCLMQASRMSAPLPWGSASPEALQTQPASPSDEHTDLQRAVFHVMGIDAAIPSDADGKEPTQFGALRIKGRAISNIRDAIAARRSGSAVLLAVALLAAWDIRFGDARSSLMHLHAWHQLARPQNVLPIQDGITSMNVPVMEAIRLSLQCHLPYEAYAALICLTSGAPNQHPSAQIPSGRQVVSFFDTIGNLVGTSNVI